METFQLRDPELARDYVLESLLLARTHSISAANVEFGLRLAMEISSDGAPLPPLGLIADIGMIASHQVDEGDVISDVAGFDPSLVRKYEDYVLGKMYADISFERACDAIARYQDREHDRAIAFIINHLCSRCGVGGAILSPAVIKNLLNMEMVDVINQAQELITPDGLSTEMIADFEALIFAIQSSGELLGLEDVFELEHGTALSEFGQRVALRQVLRAATELERGLPNQKPRSQPRRYSVATNIMEEDFYPVGGFSSISNKGSIESLLRSELAYIDKSIRPDLFDIKFARGELLYYSRDENQFLRRRLSFVFALYPDLVAARFKDSQIQWQRIILVLAMLYVTVRRLSNWLSEDALKFQLVFVSIPGTEGLSDERDLFETLFREQIDNGTVEIHDLEKKKLVEFSDDLARTSLSHTVQISRGIQPQLESFSILSQLIVDDIQPTFVFEDDLFKSQDPDFDSWRDTLECMLKFWV